MTFPITNISVKSLMNLMNLMNVCKSISYEQKTLIVLIKFIKMSYLLRNVNLVLMRTMKANYLKMSVLNSFIISSFFLSHFRNLRSL